MVESDVHELHHAMKGLGTDDSTLIDIMTHRSRPQLEMIIAAYAQKHGKTLAERIASDTSFEYKNLLVALATPFNEYIAHLIHHAVHGLGTKEWILIDVLATVPTPIINEAAIIYAAKYGEPLRKAVHDDTSYNFKRTLMRLIDGSKDWFGPADLASVEHDAKKIYQKGPGRLGTDDSFYIEWFTSRSPYHIFEVDRAYHAKYHHGLVHAIKSETSGDYRNLLVALATPYHIYWARRIHDAVEGLGTNDTLLQRAFVLNSKENLRFIAAAYQTEFGQDMMKDVKDDTSGNYHKTLRGLIE